MELITAVISFMILAPDVVRLDQLDFYVDKNFWVSCRFKVKVATVNFFQGKRKKIHEGLEQRH